MRQQKIHIPADVPKTKQQEYLKNYGAITHGLGRIALFAGDQKIEHLNDDYIPPSAAIDSADPEHMFRIASKANISCFAAQLGLISLYGRDYSRVPYIVKLNSKSNLVKTAAKEPLSLAMINIDQLIRFKKTSGLNICGFGYTIYLGSEYEQEMLHQAADFVFEAHQQGLIAIIWIYPRGKAVPNERDAHLVAGAAGVACSIGADFVKLNFPKLADSNDAGQRARAFKEAVKAAGRTKVICSGGEKMPAQAFFEQLWDQIHISGAAGNATGRNIHERPLDEAIRFANAVYAITIKDASVADAVNIYNGR